MIDCEKKFVPGNELLKISDFFDPSRFVIDYLPINFGGFISDLEQGPDGLLYCAIRGTYPEPRRHGGGIVIIDIDDLNKKLMIESRDNSIISKYRLESVEKDDGKFYFLMKKN